MWSWLVSTLVTRWAFKRSCFLINVSMSTSVLFLSVDCVETTRKDTGLEVPLCSSCFNSWGSHRFNCRYTFRIGTYFCMVTDSSPVWLFRERYANYRVSYYED